MTLEELLPALHELNRVDKWKAMQFLVTELSKEESGMLTPGMNYPVWTPVEAFEAAQTLLEFAAYHSK